jgi:membrane associated rhomboid family serine protease
MPDLPRRRRPERPSWTQPFVQRLTPTIKALVASNLLVFLAFVLVRPARNFILAHLALGPGFFHGELWQLITALFANIVLRATDGFWFLVGLLVLWFIGAFLERRQGRTRFLLLYFGAGAVSNLAVAGMARLTPGPADVFGGFSLALLALFVALGRLQGRAPAQAFPGVVLQTRLLAWGWVALALLLYLLDRNWPLAVGTVVAAIAGYLGAAPGGPREIYDAVRMRWLRRRYRVLDGGARRRSRPPKYWN